MGVRTRRTRREFNAAVSVLRKRLRRRLTTVKIVLASKLNMSVTSAKNRMKTRVDASVWSFVFAFVLLCLACSQAYGDVGVVLNESLDTSVARITGSGHSAVYFSRICPETPVKLRLCRPGEQGSVISNYTTLGEDLPFEWNAVPLNVYLYGVEETRHRPILGSQTIKHALEERYREKYLSEYCAGESCQTSGKAEWREMVGASLSRSIYIFVVNTTVEQDRNFVATFNSLPNRNHFNGVTRNCADFARRVINTYFPHAVSPDYINDFGMTSPKAIARSFTHYALQHPQAQFRIAHFAQVPGTIKRSKECRAGTEQLYHSKKLLVPMLIFADYELPLVAASYVLTGRFNPERELEEHPSVESSELEDQIRQAKSEGDNVRVQQLEALAERERVAIIGSAEEWKEYRAALSSIVEEAVRDESIPQPPNIRRLFKRLEAGTPVVDGNGAIWMEFPDGTGTSRVGLSASNVLDPGSDPQLTYQLLLARTERVLTSPKHSRETKAEFKQDWTMLRDAHPNRAVFLANIGATGSGD